MSSSDGKPSSGLFAGLFGTKVSARVYEEYQRMLAEEQERQAKKPESEERKESEPKSWIN